MRCKYFCMFTYIFFTYITLNLICRVIYVLYFIYHVHNRLGQYCQFLITWIRENVEAIYDLNYLILKISYIIAVLHLEGLVYKKLY